MNRLPWLRISIISLILYIITIIGYFLYFYEPFNPIYGELNYLIQSKHRQDIVTFFIISFLFCLVASIVISFIYEEILFYTKPIISVNAKLKSKESLISMCGDPKGFSAVGYTYNLIFEDDNGIELSFGVIAKYYFTIFEGNKGILKYKKGRFNRFIDFEIKEIE